MLYDLHFLILTWFHKIYSFSLDSEAISIDELGSIVQY